MAFSNKETQFQKGKSGNPAGRPKGAHSLDTMVRRILESEEELPPAIAKTIKRAVGAGPSFCGSGATVRCPTKDRGR
jgi:hypothetical protein